MKIAVLFASAAMSVFVGPGLSSAADLPQFQRNGQAVQLMVDGAPYLAVGGELHNSSPSSPAYMAPVWDKLARNNVRTVIGVASWEMVEPEEGRFDFTAVDDQIAQARRHGIRLILIWFGAYKNAESTYSPSWVRRDEKRFPRAMRDAAKGLPSPFPQTNPVLSVFSPQLLEADARAYARLMAHIRQVDPAHTVIMMQVENEVGLMGDSRDRSALAETAWKSPAPAALLAYLDKHRQTLDPWLLGLWKRQGFAQKGTWAQVFGEDRAAEEVFMAWHFGRYVDAVAQAGGAVHGLPAYTNAWLGPAPHFEQAGQYPSGGPVARMIDVWKAAAPSLALLAPDIYVDDFEAALAKHRRADNPAFVPEAKIDAGNLFVALGRYDAIGFNPFGLEDAPDGHDLFTAYGLVNAMAPQILKAQASGSIRGFKVAAGAQETLSLGGYQIRISGPRDTRGAFGAGTGSASAAIEPGYGLVIKAGEADFLVVGRGVFLDWSAKGEIVELDSVQEGAFKDGQWIAGRTINGDERWSIFPPDTLATVRVRVLRRRG